MNKERLIILAEALGISPSKLSKNLGKSEGYIRTMSGFAGSDLLSEILRTYPQVDAYWLILGEGKIFRNNTGTVIGDDSNISGSNITSSGPINNSVNIQTAQSGYEKIIKPDLTVEMHGTGMTENSQQIQILQDKIASMQATIDLQQNLIKSQDLTIQLLKAKEK